MPPGGYFGKALLVDLSTGSGTAAAIEEPLRVEGGFAVVPERPGNGLTWDKTALEKYRM